MSKISDNLKQVDFDFVDLKNHGLSSFHWYPATFLAALPGSIIPHLSTVGAVVFDPFCGTSTTGLESVRLGRGYIGTDRNPVAALIGRARLAFPRVSDLRDCYDKLAGDYFPVAAGREYHQNSKDLLDWYHPDTFSELNHILTKIGKISTPATKLVTLAVFSSVLKACCSQGRHWGWVCDNVKPRDGEIVYKNAISLFQRALNDYINAYVELVEDMKARGTWGSVAALRKNARVICKDAVDAASLMRDGSVDLIFTSPPYYGVADYTKSQRLSFLWFGDILEEISGGLGMEDLRLREAGARSKRHRKKSYEEYVEFMQTFFLEARRILKPKGFLCLVIGESKSRRETIDALNKVAIGLGFSEVYAVSREIKKTQRRLMAKVSNEQVIVFQIS